MINRVIKSQQINRGGKSEKINRVGKSQNYQVFYKYLKPEMRKCKKTGVHGTLQIIPNAWIFLEIISNFYVNYKQLLCKKLNSRMNIIETRAVLNKTDGSSKFLNFKFLIFNFSGFK